MSLEIPGNHNQTNHNMKASATRSLSTSQPASPTSRLTTGKSWKSLAVTAPLLILVSLSPVYAAPNGTRPTVLTNLAATSVSTSQMRVSGTLTTLSGAGIAGMRVNIYAVNDANFTLWTSAYTANNGTFAVTSNKPPVGAKIQVEVEGNAAYSRPLPTSSRP